MSISISDIQDKQFHVRFRGFDIEEVDEFLEIVAENYAIVSNDNKSLVAKMETLSEEFERIKNQESSFRNAIVSAQKIADEMIKKGREEADNLIAQTQKDIKFLKDDAYKEVVELEGRVDTLSLMQGALQQELSDVLILYQQKLDEIQASRTPDDINYNKEDTDNKEDQSEAEIESDMSDLYEKIDLEEDLASENPQQDDADSYEHGEDDDNLDDMSEIGDPDLGASSIPDLDSEIMFKLHDPLDDDESEVDVAIDSEKNNNL